MTTNCRFNILLALVSGIAAGICLVGVLAAGPAPARASARWLLVPSLASGTTTAVATATNGPPPTSTFPPQATPTQTPVLSPPPTVTATWSPAGSPTATPQPLPPGCLPIWQAVAAPTVPVLSLSALNDSDLWAIGGVASAYGGSNTSVLHQAGGWQEVPHPTPNPFPAPARDALLAIAARTDADVWAVGYEDSGNDLNTETILHYDGTSWTRPVGSVAKDRPQGGDTWIYSYNAVVAVGPTEMWAVGGNVAIHDPFLSGGTLVAHCTAAGCVTGHANDPDQTAALYGMAVVGPNDIWAVGLYARDSTSPGSSLIEHWNGSTWSVLPSPNIGPLRGVAADGPHDVWAVGAGGILHYDGLIWQPVPSPAGAAAVVAFARNDAWAVGGPILHWNGVSWSSIAGPPASLETISALGAGDIWAGGTASGGGGLIYHASATPAFADVPTTQPFYPFVQALACRGYVSGYTCGGPGEPCPGSYYRPGADVTRAQLAKIIANAAGLADPVPSGRQTFADVPPSQPFWLWIEQLAAHGAISGYNCGGPGEPCDPQQRPYFRPGANATRGQISKIVATAANLSDPIPGGQQSFADIPPSHPFWLPIERLAARGIVSGYTCGGPGEPCDPQGRAYFRSGANTTRGQMSKIAANAFLGSQLVALRSQPSAGSNRR